MPPKKGLKKGAAGYKMAPKLPNGTVLQVVKYPCHIIYVTLIYIINV